MDLEEATTRTAENTSAEVVARSITDVTDVDGIEPQRIGPKEATKRTAENIYAEVVARYITDMAEVDGPRSSAESARMLRMDESEHAFIQLLGSAPLITLDDFREDSLAISSHSFNLSPAVVAKVTAWLRLRWRKEFYEHTVKAAVAQDAEQDQDVEQDPPVP